MMLGNWKNFDELEDNLSYPELTAMVKAKRESEERNNKFMAALQGIDLGKNNTAQDDPVEAAKLRARAKLAGMREDEFKFREVTSNVGFDVVTVE